MCVNFTLISSKAGEVCFPFGAVQDGDDSSPKQIQGRPGKIGPRGPPGPVGPSAICTCGDELAQLQGLSYQIVDNSIKINLFVESL